MQRPSRDLWTHSRLGYVPRRARRRNKKRLESEGTPTDRAVTLPEGIALSASEPPATLRPSNRMQNAECRMQNEQTKSVFYSAFFILRSAFFLAAQSGTPQSSSVRGKV